MPAVKPGLMPVADRQQGEGPRIEFQVAHPVSFMCAARGFQTASDHFRGKPRILHGMSGFTEPSPKINPVFRQPGPPGRIIGPLQTTWSQAISNKRVQWITAASAWALSAVAANVWSDVGAEETAMLTNFGAGGGWYEPAASGQGFSFDVVPQTNQLVAYWFAYPEEGAPANGTRRRVTSAGIRQAW